MGATVAAVTPDLSTMIFQKVFAEHFRVILEETEVLSKLMVVDDSIEPKITLIERDIEPQRLMMM